MDKLKELLNKADRLFPSTEKPELSPYNYTLGRFPYGWKFTVTNNWYAWSDAGLKHDFGTYKEPEYAVRAFLDYVAENNIDVPMLCHEN